MKTADDLLKTLLQTRATVATLLAGANGFQRVALLRLQDSLDRWLFMLAPEVPVGKERAYGSDGRQIQMGPLLQDAHSEVETALREASVHIDRVLGASIENLVTDLAVFVAGVADVTRGSEPPRATALAESTRAMAPKAVEAAALDQVGAPKPDLVWFTASAPAQAQPRDEFVARFAAHLPQDEEQVRTALAQAAPGARLAMAPKQGGLLRGTEVEIVLEAGGLIIDGTPGRAAQRLAWEGRPQILEFLVQVPANDAAEAASKTVLRFYVRLAGVVLVRVLFELEIGTRQSASTAPQREVVGKRMPTTAFASYSSLDRPRVLDRVAAIRIAAGMDVFLDCMDLNPSECWEPRLQEEIDRRDIFILFWSKAAAQSRWVTWEWERALSAKGADAMQIQPLENGVQPPRSLRELHMADPYVDLRQAELQRGSGRTGSYSPSPLQ